MICRLATTWRSVSRNDICHVIQREMPSGNSTESVNSIKYNFSGSGVETPFLEEFLVPFVVLGGDASTQEITSESIVRRYESRWQAKSPTTRLLGLGGSRGMF